MLKIKMMHKGLILVAVPLIFGASFISLLCFSLSDVERLVGREHLLKDVISCHMTALRCAAAAKRLALEYNFVPAMIKRKTGTNTEQARNAIWEYRLAQVISDYMKEAASFDQHINVLLKNEPELLKSAQISSSLQLVGNSSSRYVSDSQLLDKLRLASDVQTRAATNAMVSLRATLGSGMVVSVVICVALAMFFCLNITNRLLLILHNTMSLTKGNKLNPPLSGNDEISELDQFLVKSATEIKELERFKQEMIGVVSHELKSPLSSVAMFLEMLRSGTYGELSERAAAKVARTSASAKRLMNLVADLLKLDRLELDLNKSEIAVDDLLKTSVDAVKELSEQSGIKIIVKSHGGTIKADGDRLVQVIVNLLSNAMKFSPANGEVTLDGSISEGWFECRVCDQGRGIPEAFRKQIFEPFKQVDAKDSTTKKGTGLGLTISRSIIEKHEGMIGVDSTEGKGSTFWFKVPVSESALDSNRVAASQNLLQLTEPAQLLRGSSISVKGNRKFSVLQQGLVIISVPLIFQISFGCLIMHSLNQVTQQIQREENSMEILNTLNRGAEYYYAAMYAFSNKNHNYWTHCLNDEDKVLAVLDKVKRLCSGDSEELLEIKESRSCLNTVYSSMRKIASSASEKEGEKASESSPSTQVTTDPETIKKIYPLFEAQKAEERLMLREREIGEKLGFQRVQMIKDLEGTLLWGIVVNIVLSFFLAAFMMRSLSNRLRHVMENTARLVRREELDPPLKGSDEIAYLDKVLFDTANHLLELEKFKQELISIVSHELRTPLMSISSALQLFETNALGELSSKGKARLLIAIEEANRLIRLINDLLDIEKMEAGKFILDSSEFNVSDLVQISFASVAQPAEAKQLILESFVADPQMKLSGDRDRLCQVLINLLSNAIKFSPENGSIKVTVERSENGELRFCVIDVGRGIPEETREKIFGRFVQVEKTDETVKGGSGLGLAISKAIVEQHGGTIGVESKIGVGSTFWFKIPVGQSQAGKNVSLAAPGVVSGKV